MFPRLAFALKKTLSFWQRRGKNKFLTQALGGLSSRRPQGFDVLECRRDPSSRFAQARHADSFGASVSAKRPAAAVSIWLGHAQRLAGFRRGISRDRGPAGEAPGRLPAAGRDQARRQERDASGIQGGVLPHVLANLNKATLAHLNGSTADDGTRSWSTMIRSTGTPPRPPKLPGSLPPRSSAQRVTDRSRASVSRRVSCRARPAPRAGDFAHSAGGSEASRPMAARWSARRSAGPRGYCSDIDGATLHASMNF